MPANRGLGSADWHPQPDFPARSHFEPTLDERVFQINDEQDVRDALLETDPTYEAYKWSLTDEEIEQLALESARILISDRNALLSFRKKQAERRIREDSYRPVSVAVVGETITSLVTGLTYTTVIEIPRARSFS